MAEYRSGQMVRVLLLCCCLWSCAGRPVDLDQLEYIVPEPPLARQPKAVEKAPTPKGPPSLATRQRVVTEIELLKLEEKDPRLTYYACQDILARLNKKARIYIAEDIRARRPLTVPIDFAAYKNWSPLPRTLPGGVDVPKLILVVKDIPFTGWYEGGRMKGDSMTCVGKQWGWTESGLYKVLDKAADMYSNLYKNAYGEPAWMPYALRIYGAVWIHAGDVVGPYCSHGCINLSPEAAERLYNWAGIGTPVVVTDSLSSLNRDLSKFYFPEERGHDIHGPSSDSKIIYQK